MRHSAHYCGAVQFPFANPNPGVHPGPQRTNLTRTFHPYLELTLQSKHCNFLRGYCQQHNVESRRRDGTQVPEHTAACLAAGGFYEAKGRVLAAAIRDQMIQKWRNGTTFTPGVQVMAAIQMQRQSDGYCYEAGYWYDGQNIYILFHCYPG
jgi:hypothetical protein